ncbi:hypothetical protein [Acutalibacter sp. JLR.KK004]|uniref:hypothetical protein n=1 Tax=Acutalibacter sp. JLR.KK004 TaxID=3112622 RepID=UPI002FF00F2F
MAISIFTVYSQTGYIANLPGVSLTRPARQEIPYELHSQATVQEGQLVCHIPFGSGVPGEVILPGQQAAVSKDGEEFGKAVVDRQEGTVYERTGVTFYLEITEGDLQEGETVNIAITGETKAYPSAVPRASVHYNERGEACLYTVESQQGPWGTRFVLQEEAVGNVWPPNNDSEYVLPSTNIGKAPIVVNLEGDRAYPGMEVRLID